ncbi:MAG TPA: hypothetical protein PKE32_09320 [Miltoncostaeaceae bacterium]|nr:hypothetical protein [Miltoncostaeaceae bacterium]
MHTSHTRPPIRALALGALAAGALWLGAAAQATPAPVVGTATTVTRTVTVTGKGIKAHPLRRGEQLRLGSRLMFGPKSGATLRLTRPAKVSADADLVLVGSRPGVPLSVKYTKKSARVVIVTVGQRAPARRARR